VTQNATQTQEIAYRFFQDIATHLTYEDIKFPTFLQASVGVREALSRSNWSNLELAKLVSSEPLLSARVVALANSAAMNTSGRHVTDVKSAVAIVGQRAVRSVAASLMVEQAAGAKELTPFRKQAKEIWEHSLAVAVMAYVLASKTKRWAADEAMFAGLVHDLGHFYLYWRATRFEELVARPEEVRALVHEWHPAIGKRLLQDLQLPESVAIACDEHEIEPERLARDSLSELLSLANRCSMAHASATPIPEQIPSTLESIGRITEASARAILKESSQEVAALLSALMGAATTGPSRNATKK